MKRVELLREVLPKIERVAILHESAADTPDLGATQAAARSLGLRLQVLNVIAWSRAARAINVTASRDAKVLEPLLDRLGGSAK